MMRDRAFIAERETATAMMEERAANAYNQAAYSLMDMDMQQSQLAQQQATQATYRIAVLTYQNDNLLARLTESQDGERILQQEKQLYLTEMNSKVQAGIRECAAKLLKDVERLNQEAVFLESAASAERQQFRKTINKEMGNTVLFARVVKENILYVQKIVDDVLFCVGETVSFGH